MSPRLGDHGHPLEAASMARRQTCVGGDVWATVTHSPTPLPALERLSRGWLGKPNCTRGWERKQNKPDVKSHMPTASCWRCYRRAVGGRDHVRDHVLNNQQFNEKPPWSGSQLSVCRDGSVQWHSCGVSQSRGKDTDLRWLRGRENGWAENRLARCQEFIRHRHLLQDSRLMSRHICCTHLRCHRRLSDIHDHLAKAAVCPWITAESSRVNNQPEPSCGVPW